MAALEGQTVLITGAARRIGRAIAIGVAEAGAGVVVHYHHGRAEALSLERELGARGRRCWLVEADLEVESELASLIDRSIGESGGPIDALVNNAAVFPTDTFESITRESFLRSLAINAWAPLVLSRCFARQERAGQIIHLLDAKLDGFRFDHLGYTASKQVLALLTRMLALELAPAVCVNAVAPGLILPPPGRDEAWLEDQARAQVPLGRPGGLNDVCEAVLFLLGSRYLTGQTLYVDGGSRLLEPANGPHPHPGLERAMHHRPGPGGAPGKAGRGGDPRAVSGARKGGPK